MDVQTAIAFVLSERRILLHSCYCQWLTSMKSMVKHFLFPAKKQLLGLHITAIRKFIKEHPKVKTEILTTSKINSEFGKPENMGASHPYLQKYKNSNDEAMGVPLVSKATVFVSHAWRYSFYDVVVNVMEQYADKFPNAYFGFDLFTNDQNEISTKDFDWFSFTFRSSIRQIGQALLVHLPWNDPIPIKRAWCLFEIHNALQHSEVDLTINLPANVSSNYDPMLLKIADA